MSSTTSGGLNVESSVNIKLVIKFCILCFMITVVWLMFTLPIVFYHLPQKVMQVFPFDYKCELWSMYNIILPQAATGMENGSGVVNTSTINCSQRFYLSPQTGMCSPVCGEWEEFSHDIVVILNIFTALLYIFHLIGTGIALAFSCYNYKIMQVLLTCVINIFSGNLHVIHRQRKV